jgi:1-acyl-sn-glycerol-3-phosphate acyltransferase
MIRLRSTLFLLATALLTIPFGILLVLLMLLPLGSRFFIVGLWRHAYLFLLKYIAGIDMRVIGRDNIPAQAAVVLCKHESAWETVALQALFVPAVFVLKRSLLLIPFFGWGLMALRMISIDRNAGREALAQVVAQGRDRLARGIWVIIFPEGTRMAPGEMGRFKPGGVHLAVKAGVPVVPVAHNAGDLWGRNSFLKKPGTITVSIGAPIDTAGRKDLEVTRLTEAWIDAEMRRIAPHRYARTPTA